MPKLLRWLKEEHHITNITQCSLCHYIHKMGFEWVKVKRKGELWNSPCVQELQKHYIQFHMGE